MKGEFKREGREREKTESGMKEGWIEGERDR